MNRLSNTLRRTFGITPWVSELPSEIRLDRIVHVVGVLAIVAAFTLTMLYMNAFSRVYGIIGGPWGVLVMDVVILGLELMVLNGWNQEKQWVADLRLSISIFKKWCLSEDESPYDPWEGMHFVTEEDPDAPMSDEISTLYLAAMTGMPDPGSDLVAVAVATDDESRQTLLHAPFNCDMHMDIPLYGEWMGCVVDPYADMVNPLSLDDDTGMAFVEGQLRGSKKVVMLTPVATMCAVYFGGISFDVRAVGVLDECAALGIGVAMADDLGPWQRLVACARELGIQTSDYGEHPLRASEMVRLVRAVHQTVSVIHEGRLLPAPQAA